MEDSWEDDFVVYSVVAWALVFLVLVLVLAVPRDVRGVGAPAYVSIAAGAYLFGLLIRFSRPIEQTNFKHWPLIYTAAVVAVGILAVLLDLITKMAS